MKRQLLLGIIVGVVLTISVGWLVLTPDSSSATPVDLMPVLVARSADNLYGYQFAQTSGYAVWFVVDDPPIGEQDAAVVAMYNTNAQIKGLFLCAQSSPNDDSWSCFPWT